MVTYLDDQRPLGGPLPSRGPRRDRGRDVRREFAQRAGTTPTNLAVLKNGRAKAMALATLAALCEVPVPSARGRPAAIGGPLAETRNRERHFPFANCCIGAHLSAPPRLDGLGHAADARDVEEAS